MSAAKQSDKTIVRRWPEGAVVYHIYPRSLQDSNGDGSGDLPGITMRLDYLVELGVTAIWLSPFYPSPMADFGYDVADYCAVDPMFGTINDFKDLLQAAEQRNIKVIIDLVPNHTSDEHEWFKQSRKNKSNDHADWYVWRDAKSFDEHGKPLPPNNWRDALTGGSAWEWVPEREQFYLHSFDVKQPDLNWSNPAMREAMLNVMRFWLDLGVDGFRVDAVYWMGKEPLLRDDAPNPNYVEGEDLLYEALLHDNSRGWPFVYAYLHEMAEVLKEPQYAAKDRFMVTEAYPERHNPLAAYMSFYVGMDPLVAAPFNFEGLSLPWTARDWRHFLQGFHTALAQFNPHCVSSYAFGNHDQPRLVSRLGEKAARSAAVMQFTLPGMIFIYYGEEIGMHDVDIPLEYVQDPAAKGDPKKGIGRDPERTPMQWSPDRNGGFSDGDKTWLPLSPDYQTRNVFSEGQDPDSFLVLYKCLAKLRTSSEILKFGTIEIIDVGESNVLAYRRYTDGTTSYLTLVNFSNEPSICQLPHNAGDVIISSEPQTKLAAGTAAAVELQAHEAALFVYRQPA